MADQFSGSNAEIWVKPEQINGVVVTDSVGTPLSTTLNAAANPGDTTITVAGITNAGVGDIIKVGTNDNMELLKIHDSTAPAGNTITLDPNTKVNYRHESGEAVLEVDPTQDWFKLGNVTNFTPNSDRPLDESQAAAGGIRAISNVRPGSYDFGCDITIEFDIETAPLWFLHALNNDYSATGVDASTQSTTLSAAASIGDTALTVTSETGFDAGEFAQIGTGDDAEVIKILSNAASTITLDPAAHPFGLRKAHANGAAVLEVIKPFSRVITKGTTLPEGLTCMLRLTEGTQESIALMAGNRINTMTPAGSGDTTISTFTINTVAKRLQVLSENIFGTPTSVAHKPYAQWEGVIRIDSNPQTDNKITNFSVSIENNVTAGRPFGTALPGSITAGQGRITATFDYEYETQEFVELTQAGSEHSVSITWTYILDSNHTFTLEFPRVIFGGPAHPAFADLGQVTDSKTFTAILDTASTPNTDIKVTAVGNNPTAEFFTEAA